MKQPFFFFLSYTIFIYLFIYLWLCWVFVSVRGLSLVVASGGHSSSRCAGLSLSRPLSLRSTGSRRAGSVTVAHGPSCSLACGIFPDQGSNPCPLWLQTRPPVSCLPWGRAPEMQSGEVSEPLKQPFWKASCFTPTFPRKVWCQTSSWEAPHASQLSLLSSAQSARDGGSWEETHVVVLNLERGKLRQRLS